MTSARLSRRGFLGVLTAGAAGLTGCGGLTAERAGAPLTSRLPLPAPFTVPLPIPARAEPGDDGVYELVQRVAREEILPGVRTEVWGYDGTFPGPTFDARRGQPIRVRVVNELAVPTSTHLHGGVTPAEFDGYPTHLVVPARLVDRFHRLRILNAGNARRLDLRLDPPPPSGAAFIRIGSDVGLLARPQRLDRIVLAGAERVDVVVDFGAYPIGTEVVLRNLLGAGRTRDVMRFDVTRRAEDDSAIPATLAHVPTLSSRHAVRTRRFDFRLSGPGPHGKKWMVNGQPFDPTSALAAPELGTTELWTLTSDFHHPVHVHLGHFQVLSRNGAKPRASDAGWKDTVDLRPYEVVQILVRFHGFTGRYVMHCHNLEHEDMAMMANIDVL